MAKFKSIFESFYNSQAKTRNKMFLTLEETAEALKCSAEDVMKYTETNLLREFRDGARSMFKSDQVYALAAKGVLYDVDKHVDKLLTKPESTVIEDTKKESCTVDSSFHNIMQEINEANRKGDGYSALDGIATYLKRVNSATPSEKHAADLFQLQRNMDIALQHVNISRFAVNQSLRIIREQLQKI